MGPDDRYTPEPQVAPAIQGEFRRLSERCTGRHERQNAALAEMRHTVGAHDTRIVVLTGEDGKNGTVGQMKKDIESVKAELKSQRQLVLRLAFWVLSSSATGAGVAHALLKTL